MAQAALQGDWKHPGFNARERAALRYAEVMWHNHNAMPDELWDELTRLFTSEELVELGMEVAVDKGIGQMIAMLGASTLETWR